jgi:hypothetical protein
MFHVIVQPCDGEISMLVGKVRASMTRLAIENVHELRKHVEDLEGALGDETPMNVLFDANQWSVIEQFTSSSRPVSSLVRAEREARLFSQGYNIAAETLVAEFEGPNLERREFTSALRKFQLNGASYDDILRHSQPYASARRILGNRRRKNKWQVQDLRKGYSAWAVNRAEVQRQGVSARASAVVQSVI